MKLAILAALSCTAIITAPADASTQTGTITQVIVDNYGGPAGFTVTGSRSAKPGCAATDDFWSIENPSTENAKAMLSAVLTAFAARKTIFIQGTASCSSGLTRENAYYIVISN